MSDAAELPFDYVTKKAGRPLQDGGKAPLLLLLHGVGSNETDLFSLAPMVDDRFVVVSLRAPITLAPGSFAWFEVRFTGEGPVIRPEQAELSRLDLINFIEQAPDVFNIDPARIYLLGFSQGAIMSLALLLTRPELTAGVVALSGRTLPELFSADTPLGDHLAPHEALADRPLLVIHGRWDEVLSVDYGRATRDRFADLPVALTYREYDMPHAISAEAMDEVSKWLAARLEETD
ncbi:MAG: alpha/beta fold hydrolase [Candidatus Promineifilaceae bacterium]|nr:alpha/beta fold hydrolase [Candidatus Promineifilaceae bacterium]